MNLFRERLKTKLVKSFLEVKQVNELERFVTIRISKVGDNAVNTAIIFLIFFIVVSSFFQNSPA